MATKTDAKGLLTKYYYDGSQRLNRIEHYPAANAPEDESARVEITYDTNPYDSSYSEYALGRMTTRKYTVNGMTFTDMYGYTRAGLTKKKRLRLSKTFVEPYPYPASTASRDLDAAWDYDSEGKVVSVTYPTAMNWWQSGTAGGETYTTGYDAMGRPVSMGSLVTNVTYGPAGELLTMTGLVNETRAYNSRLQLTQWNGTSYGYAAGLNNGRIQSETTSAETVNYQYDELNRLTNAETVDLSGWASNSVTMDLGI